MRASGFKHSPETLEKIRLSAIGRKPNLGKKFSTETRHKMRIAHLGPKSHFWRGGITADNQLVRQSGAYRAWRTSVFIRDNRTCVLCGYNGRFINADHIKSFAHHPELRFDVNNGRTLCIDCHKKTDNFGGRNNGRNSCIL